MAATSTNKTASLVLCLVMMSSLHQLLQPQFQIAAASSSTSAAAAAASASRRKISQDVHDKTVSFTLYQQETMNKTGYVVVNGVTAEGISQEPAADRRPFGSMYVFRDNLTVRADSSSRVAGVAEGSSISTSFDDEEGQRSLSMAKITVHHRGYRGSVSILGGTYNSSKLSVYPVAGGTGDFAYAVGYVRSSPVLSRGSTATYKMELRLYWPPYTNYAPIP